MHMYYSFILLYATSCLHNVLVLSYVVQEAEANTILETYDIYF